MGTLKTYSYLDLYEYSGNSDDARGDNVPRGSSRAEAPGHTDSEGHIELSHRVKG